MESSIRKTGRDHLAHTDERPPGRFVFVLICSIPIISTIAFGAVDTWATGLLFVLTAMLVCGWVVGGLKLGEFSFSTDPIQLPMIGLLLIGCIQLLPLWNSGIPAELLNEPASRALSLDAYATRLFLIRLITQIVFFAAALTFVERRERVKLVAIILVIFGALVGFFGVLQRLTNPEAIFGIRPTPQAIPFGTFVNQHHFAALMEMTSGLAIGMLFGRASGRDQKLLLGLAAIIMAIAVLFTGSRGGFISYLGVVVFAVLANFAGELGTQREASIRRRLLIFGGAILLMMLALGSVVFLGGGEGLLRGLGADSASDITSGRGHFWNIAGKIFLDHPIFGAGFDAFGVAFSRYDTWSGLYRVEQAHNDYLQTLADSGVLGFICVATFIVILVRGGLRAIADQSDALKQSISVGALAGCLGILIHSFFDFPLRTPANSFVFLLLVVLVVAPRRHHRHSN
jgi:O-antigen ligase